MKFKILALIICSLMAVGAFAAEKSRLVANLKAGKQQTVVCYGTSLTAIGDWTIQLQDALAVRYPGQALVVNSGGVSMASNWGVANLDYMVLSHNPDTVIIEFAINDAYDDYKISKEQARKNLMTMIERIRKKNKECEIVLMTMNPTMYKDRADLPGYYQIYRDVAKEQKLMLIDHYSNWMKVLQASEEQFVKYVPDTLHPNVDGSTYVITPQVFQSLGVDDDSKLVADLKAGKEQTIVAYGSSVSAGSAWTTQLQDTFNAHYKGLVNVINAGKSAMTSQTGLVNLQEQVINKKPSIVFLEFGSSDYAANIPLGQARKNLLEMINRIAKADATCQIIPLIMDPSGTEVNLDKLTEYSLMYHEVAKEQRLLCIDCFNYYAYASFTQGTLNPNPDVPRSLIAPKILKALGVQ